MNAKTSGTDFQKKAYLRVALFTVLILSIPLIAMQFTDEVNWDLADFIVMFCLLFGMGSLFIMVSRKTQPKRRAIIAIAFIITTLFIWAELAVGVFASLGS